MKFDYYILSVMGAASSIVALSFTFQSQFGAPVPVFVLPAITFAVVTYLISRYFRKRYDDVLISLNELHALLAHYYRGLCTDLTHLGRKFMRQRRRINTDKIDQSQQTKKYLDDCQRREKIRTLRLKGKLILDTVSQLVSLILGFKGLGKTYVRCFFLLLTPASVSSSCPNRHQGLVCGSFSSKDVVAQVLMADSTMEDLLKRSGIRLGDTFPADEISITDYIINEKAARYCQNSSDKVPEYRANRFCPNDKFNAVIASTSWIHCNATGKQDIFGVLVVQAVNKQGKVLFTNSKDDFICRTLEALADHLASLRFFKLK